MKIKKVCKFCGEDYFVSPYRIFNSFYCSNSCRSSDKTKEQAGGWKGGKIELTCSYCGKAYHLHPSLAVDNKYCSASCRSKATRLHGDKSNFWTGGEKEYTCIQCSKIFRDKQSRDRQFCSKQCHDKWRAINKSGEKSAAWMGGISFEPYPATFNEQFKRVIRERDNYTCAICNGYGKHVHHINYVKMDTVPENCITLCNSCHVGTNSNREYWIEWFANYHEKTQARK